MKIKISFLLSFVLLGTLAFGISPLEGYVSDENFREAEKIYAEKSNGIFQEPEVLSKENVEGTITSKFPKVFTTVNKGGIWYSNFIFIDEGIAKRKTIKGSGVVYGENKKYAVNAFSEGIIVRDIENGITAKILNERR